MMYMYIYTCMYMSTIRYVAYFTFFKTIHVKATVTTMEYVTDTANALPIIAMVVSHVQVPSTFEATCTCTINTSS